MKVPLSWLREYVDVNVPAKELGHLLTMAGIEVGEVVTIPIRESTFNPPRT